MTAFKKITAGGSSAPARPMKTSRFGSLPVYDTGGDVDVNDGKHQLAVLEDGERVLTPEQAKAQDQANANPDQIPLRDNAPAPAPKTDASSAPDPSKIIQEDKEQAAMSGDLVGMGKAVINQNHFAPSLGQINVPTSTSEVNDLIPERELPANKEMHQDVAGGPLVSGSTYDKRTSQDFASMERKARLAQYDTEIQKAFDSGDELTAHQLQLAKDNYERQTPWGSPSNHPGPLGKIGHIASRIGNIAGDIVAPETLALIPGTELNRAARRSALGSAISADTENELRLAQADAASVKGSQPKLLTGEGNVRTDSQGNRERAWEMTDGTVRWVPEGQSPSAATANQSKSPLGRIGGGSDYTYGAEKPNTSEQDKNRYAELRSKQSTGQPLSDKEQKEFNTLSAEYSVGQQAADASNRRIDAALREGNVPKSEWSDYHVSANATDAEVKEMEASAKNHAAELFQQGSEGRQMDKEDRAQDRKDKATRVYAEDENGQVRYMTKYEAEHYQVDGKSHPLSYEEMKPGDVSKDRQALRQLNDVQLNTSRYTKAAQDAIKTPPTAADYVNMHTILNKAGALDLNIAIGEGGSIKIPVLTSMIEGLNREVNSEAYAALSPQAKALVDGYIRTMSSVPAYQKALTGIGRSNKEMLDLELNNIANPSMSPKDILRKQDQFQENINRASEGFPSNLPGLKTPTSVRQETEGNTSSPPKGATGTARGSDGNYYYHDSKGNILGQAPTPKGA